MLPLLVLAALSSGPARREVPPTRMVQSAATIPNCILEAKAILVDATLPAPRAAALRSCDPGFLAAEALAKAGLMKANADLIVSGGLPAETFTGDEIRYIKFLEATDRGVSLQTDTARSGYAIKAKSLGFRDGTIGLNITVELSTIDGFTETPDPSVSLPQISTLRRDVFLRPDRRESAVIDLGILTEASALGQILGVPISADHPKRLLICLTARLAGRK